jgi:acyl-CoA thioester hydrolase
VSPVYTVPVTVRHDELDRFGRLHPAVYLRYLAHAAVEASADAGYDASWYAHAGAMWLIRRSTLDVIRPARAGERLEIRTWVEDFRRVRSHRRYTVHGADGCLLLEALTDWVYVDVGSGRPRRVPREMEEAFGFTAGSGRERDSWTRSGT